MLGGQSGQELLAIRGLRQLTNAPTPTNADWRSVNDSQPGAPSAFLAVHAGRQSQAITSQTAVIVGDTGSPVPGAQPLGTLAVEPDE